MTSNIMQQNGAPVSVKTGSSDITAIPNPTVNSNSTFTRTGSKSGF